MDFDILGKLEKSKADRISLKRLTSGKSPGGRWCSRWTCVCGETLFEVRAVRINSYMNHDWRTSSFAGMAESTRWDAMAARRRSRVVDDCSRWCSKRHAARVHQPAAAVTMVPV
jgi:hypothetical protein